MVEVCPPRKAEQPLLRKRPGREGPDRLKETKAREEVEEEHPHPEEGEEGKAGCTRTFPNMHPSVAAAAGPEWRPWRTGAPSSRTPWPHAGWHPGTSGKLQSALHQTPEGYSGATTGPAGVVTPHAPGARCGSRTNICARAAPRGCKPGAQISMGPEDYRPPWPRKEREREGSDLDFPCLPAKLPEQNRLKHAQDQRRGRPLQIGQGAPPHQQGGNLGPRQGRIGRTGKERPDELTKEQEATERPGGRARVPGLHQRRPGTTNRPGVTGAGDILQKGPIARAPKNPMTEARKKKRMKRT